MAVRVGDVGRALCAMSPSGAVEVNGVRLEARSDGLPIGAGSRIVVVRGDPTGYVVRRLGPDEPVPRLPGHGRPIPKAQFQRNHAEVAEADREERATRRRELLRRMRAGSLTSAAVGGLAGLASAAVGRQFDWFGAADATGWVVLFAGSLLAGVVWGVGLYFLSGTVGAVFEMVKGEAAFSPDYLTLIAGLAGAATGFWREYGSGDATALAAWTAGVSLAAALVARLVVWVAGAVLEATAGVG